jgi:hypothetical protein
MRVFIALCAAVVSAATLAARGGSEHHPAAPSISASAAVRPSSPPRPASASPRRTALAAPQTLSAGRTFDSQYVMAKGAEWRATGPLYEARPNPGQRYAAAPEVKVSAKRAVPAVSNAPSSLVGADSGNYDTVITGVGLSEPQYPGGCAGGQQLAVSESLLDRITYVVPASAVIVAAKYSPTGDNGKPEPVGRWTVG